LKTFEVRPDAPATAAPLIQWGIWRSASLFEVVDSFAGRVAVAAAADRIGDLDFFGLARLV
jgi:hypothetical protein